MSAELRTPLKIAVGLGSAKSGVHHFMVQRVTAVALAGLVLWVVWIVLEMLHLDYAAARALIRYYVSAEAAPTIRKAGLEPAPVK